MMDLELFIKASRDVAKLCILPEKLATILIENSSLEEQFFYFMVVNTPGGSIQNKLLFERLPYSLKVLWSSILSWATYSDFKKTTEEATERWPELSKFTESDLFHAYHIILRYRYSPTSHSL